MPKLIPTEFRELTGFQQESVEDSKDLKFSLKRGCPLNFTKCTSKQDELELMERLVSEQTAVPDDLNEYISSLLHQVAEEDNKGV